MSPHNGLPQCIRSWRTCAVRAAGQLHHRLEGISNGFQTSRTPLRPQYLPELLSPSAHISVYAWRASAGMGVRFAGIDATTMSGRRTRQVALTGRKARVRRTFIVQQLQISARIGYIAPVRTFS